MTRVGVIGVGAMGAPMARRLIDHGDEVTVLAAHPGSAAELIDAGARRAGDPATLASGTEVVILALPGAEEVASVLFGESGVLSADPLPGLVIDTSTISPDAARAHTERCAGLGVELLDAPVSGGPSGAQAGTLSVMIGGADDAVARARGVMAPLASRIAHFGPAGAGQVCKAVNQLVVMSNLQAVAEALALAESAGLDADLVRDTLLGGYAASRVLEVHGRKIIDRDFVPGGRARFNLKDIDAIGELAGAGDLELPGFAAAARTLERLVDAGGGDLDNAAVFSILTDGRPPT